MPKTHLKALFDQVISATVPPSSPTICPTWGVLYGETLKLDQSTDFQECSNKSSLALLPLFPGGNSLKHKGEIHSKLESSHSQLHSLSIVFRLLRRRVSIPRGETNMGGFILQFLRRGDQDGVTYL